jgi:hypothetical protein
MTGGTTSKLYLEMGRTRKEGGMATSRNIAIAVGITLALLASCAAPAPPAGFQVGTTFDGSYAGDGVLDTARSGPSCTPGGHVVLHVANGYATIEGATDKRTGWVSSDGSLKMTGRSSTLPAEVEGSFSNGVFTGTSVYTSLPCVYGWSLKRL